MLRWRCQKEANRKEQVPLFPLALQPPHPAPHTDWQSLKGNQLAKKKYSLLAESQKHKAVYSRVGELLRDKSWTSHIVHIYKEKLISRLGLWLTS